MGQECVLWRQGPVFQECVLWIQCPVILEYGPSNPGVCIVDTGSSNPGVCIVDTGVQYVLWIQSPRLCRLYMSCNIQNMYEIVLNTRRPNPRVHSCVGGYVCPTVRLYTQIKLWLHHLSFDDITH